MNLSDTDHLDRRVERTRAALWEALFALLHETVWHDINVSTICRRAGVARSSFYLHFQNKQELLDFGFDTGLRAARAEIAGYAKTVNGFASLHWLAHHIHSVHGLQRSKFVEDAVIYSRFQRAFAGLFREDLQRVAVRAEPHRVSFVLGGTFAVVQAWATSTDPVTPDLLAERLNELAVGLLDRRRAVAR